MDEGSISSRCIGVPVRLGKGRTIGLLGQLLLSQLGPESLVFDRGTLCLR